MIIALKLTAHTSFSCWMMLDAMMVYLCSVSGCSASQRHLFQFVAKFQDLWPRDWLRGHDSCNQGGLRRDGAEFSLCDVYLRGLFTFSHAGVYARTFFVRLLFVSHLAQRQPNEMKTYNRPRRRQPSRCVDVQTQCVTVLTIVVGVQHLWMLLFKQSAETRWPN